MRRMGWLFLLAALSFAAALCGWDREERETPVERGRKAGLL